MTTTTLTLLFADICNSTQLYETLGDHDAKEQITNRLNSIKIISEQQGGTVVKTIGDELLIRFDTAEGAVIAACEMQKPSHTKLEQRLDIRVALHCGPTIMENNDVFGDSVNIAARLVTLSKPGQILTSRETVELLPPLLFERCRHIDKAPVKGKKEDINIYEIFNEEDDVTQMTVGITRKSNRPSTLHMSYKQEDYIFHSKQTLFTIGRGEQCDLIIDEELASRQHLTLENRRGKLFIIDVSTNGTWVKNEKGREMFIRREEMLLPPEGNISFGKSFREFPEHFLEFRISRD